MRIVGWILVALLAVAAALTLNPEWIGVVVPPWAGLTVTYPVSQVIALRPLLIGVFGVIAVILLVVGLVRRFGFRGGSHSLALALALALVAGGHLAYLWSRGLSNPAELGPDRGVRAAEEGDGTLTVLTYNTDDGATGADDIADVAGAAGADVLVLTETDIALAEQIASFLTGEGETFQVFTPPVPEEAEEAADSTGNGEDAEGDEELREAAPIALLVSSALGEYVLTDPPVTGRGAIRAEPASGEGPVLVGVHVTPPLRELQEEWLADLEAVAELCHSGPSRLVLAGDLNATLDHAPLQDLGGCSSAAVEAGVGGLATWPASLPRFAGAPIDHVLIDAAAYEATQGRVVGAGGSDHRGVLVRVRPTD